MANFVPLIDPRDLRIYRVPSDKAKLYRENGWADPDNSPEPQSEAIKKELSGWYENGQAVAFTFARGIPLATKALSKVVDKATFQNLALKAQILDDQHPLLAKGLEISGGLATIPVGGAIGKGVGLAAGAAGELLGFGAEAAGAAGIAGEAAGAAGEAAGEATGLGSETAAAAGDVAAAGDAAAGARAQITGPTLEQRAIGGTRSVATVPEAESGALARTDQLERSTFRDPIVEGPSGITTSEQAANLRNGDFYRKAYAQDITDAELIDPAERFSGVPLGEEGAGLGSELGIGVGAEAGGVSDAGAASGGAAQSRTNLADLLTRYPRIAQTGKLAGIGAAQNAAFGAAYRIDNQALEHALDPQGQEKLTFEANDVLLDAALGAAVPVGLSGLGAALGRTGRALRDKSITMFRGAILKSDMLDAALSQGREGSFYRLLDSQLGRGEGEIARNLNVQVGNANQGLNVIKARYRGVVLSPDEKGQILADVRRITGTHQDPLYQDIERGLNRRIDLTGLQSLTRRIDKSPNIVWNDPEFAANPRNLIGRDVRDVLAGWQRRIIRENGVTGVEDALQWERLNQQSSDAQLILGALASKRGIGVDQLLQQIGVAAATGGALGAVGLAGNAGAVTAAAQTAGWQAVRHLKIKHVAPFVNRLGRTLLATDQRIANVLDAGLRGVPGQVHKLYTSPDYDSVAAAVSLAGRDPAKTIANLQTHHNEQGMPEEISIPIVQAQAAGLSHLANSIPKRNDAVDVSTRDTGDPVQQHRWLDQVKTFQDPTFGLANPTADNLRILKQFYPQTLFTAQQALYNQLAKNPNLPSEAQAWASRILERPVNNLDSPTFAQTLNQARQQKQAAQAPPNTQRGNGSQNGVESSLTRADQLQNR